ncbi:hypothetical protein HYDPIDRAFT_25217 [Hydnomerulius pinastri MD-312]|nr:hypothetical protein HYDPIDRAFT_25217 [Hydnomerulius pinastri MD-312]
MHRALVSLSIGDSDKPTNSPYVPPPIQRLSLQASTVFSLAKSPSVSDPSPSAIRSSSQGSPAALPGPNRAPSTTITASCSQSPSAGPSCPRASNIFPYLHRLEIVDDMASRNKKRPLLDLKLSSQSFLDAVATDLASEKPLYSVETVGSSTTIWRSDPWDGSAKIADIRWPKELPLKGKGRDNTHGALLQMNGSRWKESTNFLKYGSLGSSRKFNIPHHPHALKWKRSGSVYQCMTATCKGPVATLESFDDDTAPKLKVYETLGNFHESVPQLDHAGISLSLLDHLFVTALLLVTEPEDWMTISRNPMFFENHSTDALSRPKSTSAKTPASARQWRKIMYGEPLYPSLKTPAFDKGAVASRGEDADVLDISEPAQLPTSIQQWRKIVYGEPLYPSLRPQSADGLDIPPRPNTAWDTASISSESAYYPATPSSAPSTGFYDASSLFDESERTVPRISTENNRRYTSPLSYSPAPVSPMPSSECMPLSSHPSSSPRAGGRRELPAPPSSYNPPPSTQPWLHRSRSSPRLSPATTDHKRWMTEDGVRIPSTFDDQDDPAESSPRNRALSSGFSIRRRQLPTIPPPRASTVQSPPAQPRPHSEKRLSQTQRTLPPTPGPISRSPSATGHRHAQSHSQATPSQPPTTSTPARPSTANHASSATTTQGDAAAQGRRQRHEKNPDELVNWMRNVTRAHHRRVLEGEDQERPVGPEDPIYEAPPPAYNAIDFSTPPQARSPAGAHS